VSERWWTVDEANAALERVTAVVERARAAARRHREHAERGTARVSSNGHGDDDPVAAFSTAISELEAEGIVLRDVERGLIDFPAQSASGRPYWLCWLVGEPAVEWWHWPDAGFAGRTPLTDPPT
jgi:hypothetical protein